MARYEVRLTALSLDQRYIAIITPDAEIRILDLLTTSSQGQVVKEISLPNSIASLATNKACVLTWAPDLYSCKNEESINDEDVTSTRRRTWLLLSDLARLVVLCIDLPDPNLFTGTETDMEMLEQYSVAVDMTMETHHGKLSYVDFIFSHRHVLVLFEMNTHASVISLIKPERTDIPSPKYSTDQGLAWGLKGRCVALLQRIKGQDQVVVYSAQPEQHDADGISASITFTTNTLDAQGLQFSPDNTPVLAVWESAAYGCKILFFTAMGHALRQLDYTGPNSPIHPSLSSVQGSGITTISWTHSLKSTYTTLALGVGEKIIIICRQNTKSLTVETLPPIHHPNTIETTTCAIWHEPDTSNHKFTRESASQIELPLQSSDVSSIDPSADGTLLATRLTNQPKVLWIWQTHTHTHTSQPAAVILFHHPIRSLSWHPSLPVLLICTSRCVYIWHDIRTSPLPLDSHNISTSSTSSTSNAKHIVTWLSQAPLSRQLLMQSRPTLSVGYLGLSSQQLVFRSILHDARDPHLDLMDHTRKEEEGEEDVYWFSQTEPDRKR